MNMNDVRILAIFCITAIILVGLVYFDEKNKIQKETIMENHELCIEMKGTFKVSDSGFECVLK